VALAADEDVGVPVIPDRSALSASACTRAA
jgi:hypothetical protein